MTGSRSAAALATALTTLLAACAPDEQSSPLAADLVDQPGWRVAPAGDLNSFFDCLEGEGVTLVSAHRGGPYAGLPENAIETMAAILTDTPALMEIDVATSADGVLYLMHDDQLDRTTTGSGDANAADWADIRRLRLEDNSGDQTSFAPPRFEDALAWAEGKTILQIDFKRSTSYDDVADIVREQDAENRVILIAYSMASAAKLHRLMPEAMISLSVNSQSEVNRAVAAGVPADRILGFTGTESPRARLFSTLNSREIEVIFGTLGGRNSIDADIAAANENSRYAEIAGLGVDIIATDRPREAHRALEQSGRAAKSGVCGIELGGLS